MRALLLFLLGAAFPLGVYYASFYPERRETLSAAEARLSSREKELQSLTAVADRLPDFQREQQEMAERLTELERVRPPSSDVAPLVEELRGLAASEGVARVSIEEIAEGAEARESDTLPLRLRAEGSQRQLAALVSRLGGTTRLLRLERVELERQDGGRFALALRLCAFREKPTL